MNRLLTNINLTFWIFTTGVVFILTLPILFQHAMFQDAMLYSCVSHNLGIGYGTFWFPQYSTLNIEGIPSFHEQLPLVFGIQSIFYRIFGDSIYIERYFVVATIILHMILINSLWKIIFNGQKKIQKLGWLPVMFWILIPICFWSFRGNMLENTVSVFSLIAVIYCFKGMHHRKFYWRYWAIAGLFIFFASFSKGLPGLFPLSFPFLYYLVFKRQSLKTTLLQTSILFAIPALIYFAFYLHPTSYESLRIYVVERLLARVNSMPTADNRFYTLIRLIQELLPIIGIVVVFILFTKRKKRIKFLRYKKIALFIFLLGLTAILPLMLTMVQKGWYMVPGFPFLAMGLAMVIAPLIPTTLEYFSNKTKKILFLIAYSFFTFTFFFSTAQFGKISRHETMLNDVFKIGASVEKFSTITVPEEMYYQYDFILQGFLVRYYNISISPEKKYMFFLKERGLKTEIPEGYSLLDIDLEMYDLYINLIYPDKEPIPFEIN